MIQRVRSPLIGTGNITGNLIATTAVAGNNIVPGTITGNLLAQQSVSGNNLAENIIRGNNIVAGTITGNLLAQQSVSGNNLAENIIRGNNIVAGTITGNLLAQQTITGDDLADNIIRGNNIVAGEITGNLLGLNSVSSNNISANIGINTSRIFETVNISPQAATGTLTINVLDSAIHYYQGNVNSNVTVNLRGNSTAALGSVLSVGQASSVALLIPIGGTQYIIQAIQIDGVAQTVRWGGNTKPSYNAGIGNAFTDSYSIIAIKETPSSYIVLASNTAFGVGA